VVTNHGAAPYTVLQVGTLNDSGRVDLTNNALTVSNSSLGAINTLVATGYANGTWQASSGILSSTAAADTSHLTALGVISNNLSGAALYGSGAPLGLFENTSPGLNAVLVKDTYYGDTNLDGRVDSTDYTRIDNGYLSHLTGWFNGDFNYDGVVNGSDYTLIDNAFNTQGAAFAAEVAQPSAQIAATASAVPEPASLSIFAIAGLALLGRRRRQTIV
jgi:hypothetical protein